MRYRNICNYHDCEYWQSCCNKGISHFWDYSVAAFCRFELIVGESLHADWGGDSNILSESPEGPCDQCPESEPGSISQVVVQEATTHKTASSWMDGHSCTHASLRAVAHVHMCSQHSCGLNTVCPGSSCVFGTVTGVSASATNERLLFVSVLHLPRIKYPPSSDRL